MRPAPALLSTLLWLGCNAGTVTTDEPPSPGLLGPADSGGAAGAAGAGAAAGGGAGARPGAGGAGAAGAGAAGRAGGTAGAGGGAAGGAGAGAGGGAGGAGAGPDPAGGFVAVSSSGGAMPGYQAFAGFGSGGACASQVVGPCILSTCTSPPTPADAGVITITGGAEAVTLTPQAGTYPPAEGMRALWTGGEVLRFSAAGGTVPAFSGTVTAPPQVVVSTLGDAAWPTAAVPLPRSAPLVIRWSTGAMTDVLVYVDTQQGGVGCAFPASAGTGTVPAEALAALPAGAAFLSVSTIAGDTVTAGAFAIDLELQTAATTQTGAFAGAEVTLQ